MLDVLSERQQILWMQPIALLITKQGLIKFTMIGDSK